jgi:hypothetical protein
MSDNMNTKVLLEDKKGTVVLFESMERTTIEMTQHGSERQFLIKSDNFVLTTWRDVPRFIFDGKFESARNEIIQAGQKCANQEALNAYYHCLSILEAMRNE